MHSDMGGGNGNRALNWIALNWMFQHAERAGLPISDAAIARNLEARDACAISQHKIDALERSYFPSTACTPPSCSARCCRVKQSGIHAETVRR